MINEPENINELCAGCVYFPQNLPEQAYPADDWKLLQQKSCSFDYAPDDSDCRLSRKTSCSIVDMKKLSD